MARVFPSRKLAYVIVLMAALLAAAGLFIYSRQAAPENSTCTRLRIPTRSCQRALQAGYYCPSWDTPPGHIAPLLCYSIRTIPGV